MSDVPRPASCVLRPASSIEFDALSRVGRFAFYVCLNWNFKESREWDFSSRDDPHAMRWQVPVFEDAGRRTQDDVGTHSPE